MKVINKKIAHLANKEDECTGHFWESRYKSQALLDEKAVLSAMTYVDLNPVRAAEAATSETSKHTSIKLRIDYWKKKANKKPTDQYDLQPRLLMPFAGDLRQPMPRGLVFNLIDYLELVDWTGRIIKEDKRGAITQTAPLILQRLGISTIHWFELCTQFEKRFKGIAGSAHSIKKLCAYFGLSKQVNRSSSEVVYS